MTDEPAGPPAPGVPAPPDPAASLVGAHLDLDALADALVGEPVDDAHLTGCTTCRARLAELAAADAELRTSLARLAPPELPVGVLDRWQEALRTSAADAPPARVVDLRSRRRTWPTTVAASLVLALAGGWGWSALRDGGLTAGDTASTAAGGGAQSSTGTESSDDSTGTDDRAGDPAAGAALAPDQRLATRAAVPAGATGLDYADAAQRSAAVAQVLGGGAPAAEAAPPATAAAPGDGLDRLRDPLALDACLSALDGPALAVDYAQHAGRPAVAVLRADDDPRALAVTVVGGGCSAADPQVLLRTSVRRPG